MRAAFILLMHAVVSAVMVLGVVLFFALIPIAVQLGLWVHVVICVFFLLSVTVAWRAS